MLKITTGSKRETCKHPYGQKIKPKSTLHETQSGNMQATHAAKIM